MTKRLVRKQAPKREYKWKPITHTVVGSINHNTVPLWRTKDYEGSPLDTFDKAIRSVNNNRGKNYGHPAVNFDRIARIHSVIADCPNPRARVTLGELAVKMSRLIENPHHLDSWIDIAGYARAQVMIMQREEGCPDFPSQGTTDNTGD